MKEFKQETYKSIKIKYFVYDNGTFSASALNILFTNNTGNDRGINNTYPNLMGAEEDIKSKIDNFLSNTPKNFNDLAEVLHAHLTWTGYENCYLDEFVCKTIIENFMKIHKSS